MIVWCDYLVMNVTHIHLQYLTSPSPQANMNLIKGGGGCHVQEKIVAFASKTLIICADDTKDSMILGEKWKKGIPVEVIPLARVPFTNYVEQRLQGKATLRMAQAKAGPVVSDNGNLIIDCDFGQVQKVTDLEANLSAIPGVVSTGLFVNMARKAYFGDVDGGVHARE